MPWWMEPFPDSHPKEPSGNTSKFLHLLFGERWWFPVSTIAGIVFYIIYENLNVISPYKKCSLYSFHLLWLFFFCRPIYLSGVGKQGKIHVHCYFLPACSPYAVLGPWFLRAFQRDDFPILSYTLLFLYIWRRCHTSWLQNHLHWICAYWNQPVLSPWQELHLMEVLTGSAIVFRFIYSHYLLLHLCELIVVAILSIISSVIISFLS